MCEASPRGTVSMICKHSICVYVCMYACMYIYTYIHLMYDASPRGTASMIFRHTYRCSGIHTHVYAYIQMFRHTYMVKMHG